MPYSIRQLTAAVAFALATPAIAQFAPAGATISTTVGAQSLTANTGTIDATGAISISSNGVALGLSGSATLINNGTIQTTGTGRAIDSNSGIADLTVNNTGLISSVSSDAFRVNTNSAVSLTNSGTIRVTAGGQAIDWASITSASNVLTNEAGGVISTVGEDAVRPGTNGVVNNAGTIQATPSGSSSPSGSDGIDVRTFNGIEVNNTGLITGRHGIATDGSNAGPSTITVNNNSGGTIRAINGSGLNIDGVSATVTAQVLNQQGATIQGGVLAAANEGDGDGLDIDGVLTLDNAGDILGLGARGAANNAEGIAAGGGTITNAATGRIIGSTLLADAPNGDASKAGNGILIDDSDGGDAVAATAISNSGLIEGVTGTGIKMVGNFANTITNNAGGTIRGAGTVSGSGAAVQTGNGNDVITNGGAIVGNNGLAIDMQGGNNTLKIIGGAASIAGEINGGTGGNNTLILAMGGGNSFSSASLIANFGAIEVESGSATLSGNSDFSNSALVMKGGAMTFANAGDQAFGRFDLLDNAILGLDLVSALTFEVLGTITSGKTLAVVDYLESASPNYAFRLFGDYTGDADFLALIGATSINGTAAAYSFDGTYTDVTAVPEPSIYALLALAGGILLLLRRRRGAVPPALACAH
jgi:hypothetical protein